MAPTGFGTVTQDLGRRLLDLGEDVRFISLNEGVLEEPFASRTLAALTFEWAAEAEKKVGQAPTDRLSKLLTTGMSELPMFSRQPWGTWKPEAVILLGDFAAVRMLVGQGNDDTRLNAFRDIPTYHYCPVEGVDLPPLWKELWDVVRPVAMSKFGQAEIAKVVGYEPPMIYHGVDSETFHPASPERPIRITSVAGAEKPLKSKDDCKTALAGFLCDRMGRKRIPRNWLLRTDRHMPRKQLNAMLDAVGPVLRKHPDWALVLHCQAHDQGGYLFDSTSKHRFDDVREQIFQTDYRGMPRDLLVTLYNAADIYLSTSAEGFGLTVAEALACGVPAVAADYSAVPEVVGKAGIVVGGSLIYNEYDHFWFTVNQQEYGAAVEFLMGSRKKREKAGALGAHRIRSLFRWDTAARQFRDLLHSASLEAAA